jgi:hypothetical protein
MTGSFIINYTDKYVPETAKEFYSFADNCPGQNNDHGLVRQSPGMYQLKYE